MPRLAFRPFLRPSATPGLSREQRDCWESDGYLVLPGFFSDEQVESVNEYVDRLWEGRRSCDQPIVLDYRISTPQEGRSLLREAPDGARDLPYKLNDLYLASPVVRALSLAPRLTAILDALLGGEAMAINTLNFERGSQQPYHFDTFFMPAPVPNKMLATWIALEDIERSTGPLGYYPASIHLRPFRFSHGDLWASAPEMPSAQAYIQDRVRAAKLTERVFVPRKGDVFIWHSQLLHGGSPIDDLSRTRKSLVTHYFRVDDFDLQLRDRIGPDELRKRFTALGPAWRGAYVHPLIERSESGGAYLDKWKIPPATPEDALRFGCP